MFDVEFYEEQNGEKPVEDFINSLEVKVKAKLLKDIELLSIYGNMLGEQYSKHLQDGIYELRTKQGSNCIRSLYFFMVDKKIIITNGFVKKTQKTPKEEIKKAKIRRSKYLGEW